MAGERGTSVGSKLFERPRTPEFARFRSRFRLGAPHRRARTDETQMTDPNPDLVKTVAAAIKLAWDKRPLYAGDIIEIDCAPLAKAAIEAMREPTTEMKNEITAKIPDDDADWNDAICIWQAGIDAALGEK